MATQELAGFLAAVIFAQKTGLIDRVFKAEKAQNGGLIGPPAPDDDLPKDDTQDDYNPYVCLTFRQYENRYGKATQQEYQEYIKLSGCELIPI